MIAVKHKLEYEDLVCRHIHNIYGEKGCSYLFDPNLIEVLKFLRDETFKLYQLVVNTWAEPLVDYPEITQRGLYCNLCVKSIYKTNQNTADINAHVLGKAIDFRVYDPNTKKFLPIDTVEKLLTADTVKLKIPYKINMRINKKEEYVHIDTLTTFTEDKEDKIVII